MKYLKENNKDIFVEKKIKFNLKHFKVIEIQFDRQFHPQMYMSSHSRGHDFGEILHSQYGKKITTQYSIHESEIKITNVSECIDFIHDNVIDWCQRLLKAKRHLDGRMVCLYVCQ